MFNSSGSLTNNYNGIFNGSNINTYVIPGSSNYCVMQIDMPLSVTIKQIYHDCSSGSTDVSLCVKGSNNGGYTWTNIIDSHVITNSNKTTANTPTINSTNCFSTIRIEMTNKLSTNALIYFLDFVGDFYNISPTLVTPTSLIASGMYLIGDSANTDLTGVISYNTTYFTNAKLTKNTFTISGISNGTEKYQKSAYNGIYIFNGNNLKYSNVSNCPNYYILNDLTYNDGYNLGTSDSTLTMKLPFFMYVTKIRWYYGIFGSSPKIQLSGSRNNGNTWTNITNTLTISTNDSNTTTLLTGNVDTSSFANTYNYFRITFSGNGSQISYFDIYGDICG